MNRLVMDKLTEILNEFNYNSPIPVDIHVTRGEYTENGELIKPYEIVFNPNCNMSAIVKYRNGIEESFDFGTIHFIPERIYRLIKDFCKIGCKDFDFHF